MKTIKEIAESYAQWILRREGALKSAQLPKVLEGMLKEQRKADADAFCQFLTDYAKMIYWEVESPSTKKPMGEIFRDIVQARLGIIEGEDVL